MPDLARLLTFAVVALAAATPHSAAPPPWTWPLAEHQVVRPWEAPPHRYGPGHRGLDLAGVGPVTAPDAGVVAFAGSVAGRGIVTIDHGDGLVSTLEPVAPLVTAGEPVVRGQVVAELTEGGHAAAGTLHLGARRDGEYVNPLALLRGIRPAVLLPCC
jgi:murein DD-endopeptidase MepM/ murein hydrolase activator NlpD